jgi:hypothetical protein
LPAAPPIQQFNSSTTQQLNNSTTQQKIPTLWYCRVLLKVLSLQSKKLFHGIIHATLHVIPVGCRLLVYRPCRVAGGRRAVERSGNRFNKFLNVNYSCTL